MAYVPTLLEDGRITGPLTLGTMQMALARRLSALTNFLTQRGIQVQQLLQVLPEITPTRNRAVHDYQPSLREEASQIRCRWLGKTEGFPNIFAILLPDHPAPSVTGARP